MEKLSQNKTWGIIVVAVLLVGIAWFLMSRTSTSSSASPSAVATSSATTTSTNNTSATISTTGSTGYKVTSVSHSQPVAVSRPTPPTYKIPITCPPKMDATLCTNDKALDAKIIQRLDANITDIPAWTDLGTVRVETGDYTGALSAWNYLAKLVPNSSGPYYNLGELYMTYIKDYPKAEANFLKALQFSPKDTSIYTKLFSLYTDTSYKPTATAAEEILRKGIMANPNAIDLQVVLARYYVSLGRATDAKTAYDAAIATAERTGNTSLSAQIKAEAAGK